MDNNSMTSWAIIRILATIR